MRFVCKGLMQPLLIKLKSPRHYSPYSTKLLQYTPHNPFLKTTSVLSCNTHPTFPSAYFPTGFFHLMLCMAFSPFPRALRTLPISQGNVLILLMITFRSLLPNIHCSRHIVHSVCLPYLFFSLSVNLTL
jgi:hypothetical protein